MPSQVCFMGMVPPSKKAVLVTRTRPLYTAKSNCGGGLGELQGKVWRVGLMGDGSRAQNVLYFLFALETCLPTQGFQCPQGAGVQAAAARYTSSPS